MISAPDDPDRRAGHSFTADQIADLAHDHSLHGRPLAIGHGELLDSGRGLVVETEVAGVSQQVGSHTIGKGSWIVAVKIFDPGIIRQVGTGRLNGFSVYVRERDVADEGEDEISQLLSTLAPGPGAALVAKMRDLHRQARDVRTRAEVLTVHGKATKNHRTCALPVGEG